MFYEAIWEYGGYKLVKRPDTPSLYIAWFDQGTKRYERLSTKTADLERAQQRLLEFREERVRGARTRETPQPREVLIEETISHYLDRKLKPGNPSRRTAEENLIALRSFFAEYGLRHVSDLDPDTMDLYGDFRNELFHTNQLRQLMGYRKYAGCREADLLHKLKDISDATIARELSVLNAALRFYQKRGRITKVPFIQLPPPVDARGRWLTREEFQRLYHAAQTQRLRDYLLLAIYTLQRPGFLYGLRVEQVDFERRRIDFRVPGRRQNRKGRPAIRISGHLAPVMERLLHESCSGYLLERHGKPITSLKASFDKAVERAGLGSADPLQRVIPYTLRHTGATWLAQEGVDLWQIAGMLGHKDTRMVERVYAKHHPDFQRKATDTLDQLVSITEPRLLTQACDSDASARAC